MRRSVGLMLGALLAVTGCTSGSDPVPSAGSTASTVTTTPASPGSPTDALAAPPSGTRWQGGNGVVVAVPDDWDTITGVCAQPHGDAVRYLSRAQLVTRCPHTGGSPARSVLVVALTPVTGRMIAGRLPVTTEVGGVEVHSSRARCPAAPARRCTLTFAAPDAGVVFQLRYRGPDPRAFVGALRGSLTELPPAYTTVPVIAYGTSDAAALRRLAAAGLVAEEPDVDFPHYVTGTVPAAGTPVLAGSTIELQIGDG